MITGRIINKRPSQRTGQTNLFPFAEFSANVEMTEPRVNKLVLMYFPSRVLSLSDVAFSEPARSIKLWIDA